MVYGTLLGIVAIICAIWVIYDVLVNNRRLSDGMKIIWIICAVIVGVLLWFDKIKSFYKL